MTNPVASINCATAEQVVHHWLAGKAAHTKRDSIQAGGEGNGLLSKRYADYYKGSRFWTDGVRIYSYSTWIALYETEDSEFRGVVWSQYYKDGEWSATTMRHIRAIHNVLGTPMPNYRVITSRSR